MSIKKSPISKYGTLRVERAERLLAASALTSLRKKMRLEPLFFCSHISHITYLSLFHLRLALIWKDRRRLPGSKRSKAELPQCWAISYLS